MRTLRRLRPGPDRPDKITFLWMGVTLLAVFYSLMRLMGLAADGDFAVLTLVLMANVLSDMGPLVSRWNEGQR